MGRLRRWREIKRIVHASLRGSRGARVPKCHAAANAALVGAAPPARRAEQRIKRVVARCIEQRIPWQPSVPCAQVPSVAAGRSPARWNLQTPDTAQQGGFQGGRGRIHLRQDSGMARPIKHEGISAREASRPPRWRCMQGSYELLIGLASKAQVCREPPQDHREHHTGGQDADHLLRHDHPLVIECYGDRVRHPTVSDPPGPASDRRALSPSTAPPAPPRQRATLHVEKGSVESTHNVFQSSQVKSVRM